MKAKLNTSLPKTCDVNALEAFSEQMEAITLSKTHHNLKCDLVDRITTPFIQLMIAFDSHLTASGKKLVVEAPSLAMQAAFSTLGLTAHLEKWSKNS